MRTIMFKIAATARIPPKPHFGYHLSILIRSEECIFACGMPTAIVGASKEPKGCARVACSLVGTDGSILETNRMRVAGGWGLEHKNIRGLRHDESTIRLEC